MSRNTRSRASLLAPLLGSALLLGAAADAKPLRIHTSGVSIVNSELDIDGDGQGASLSTSSGRSNFGSVDNTGSFDIAPWDGFSTCPVDGGPDVGFGFGFGDQGTLLTYVGGNTVFRTERGDQLWARMDTAPPSTLCANPADSSFTFEIHVVVTGGTGRFAGATGAATIVGEGQQQRPGFSTFTATTTGNVQLVKPRRGHRRDHDDHDD